MLKMLPYAANVSRKHWANDLQNYISFSKWLANGSAYEAGTCRVFILILQNPICRASLRQSVLAEAWAKLLKFGSVQKTCKGHVVKGLLGILSCAGFMPLLRWDEELMHVDALSSFLQSCNRRVCATGSVANGAADNQKASVLSKHEEHTLCTYVFIYRSIYTLRLQVAMRSFCHEL